MPANLVRLALAAELFAWTAIGAWLRARSGWSIPALAAAAVAGALGMRLVLVGLTLCISWFARSPRAPGERLGLAGTVRLVAGEWRAMLANNFLWLPFERRVLRPDPPLVPDARVPVILVHGYLSNRGTLCGLAHALDAAGIGPVFVPSLPAIVAPIETFASHLDRVVHRVTEMTGQPRVILVGHSMGGLIARAWLARHGTSRIAGLVTLGSPHHGTALAPLGTGRNARQMRIGSDFLRELAGAEGGSGPGCAALSVYTAHDNLVAPQESSRLAWARNVAIHGVGHLAMLLDARVHEAVGAELVRLRERPGT
ncbi:MAG: alpha/beta fold hydrolase [Betaproteobacteria bacterium]|nr:alpha/beta fold hydrolase [Betaproteobacteria bacterium]